MSLNNISIQDFRRSASVKFQPPLSEQNAEIPYPTVVVKRTIWLQIKVLAFGWLKSRDIKNPYNIYQLSKFFSGNIWLHSFTLLQCNSKLNDSIRPSAMCICACKRILAPLRQFFVFQKILHFFNPVCF